MSTMRILVVGSGAREHALCWRLATEGHQVIAAPGNPLMSDSADVRAAVGLSDPAAIVEVAVGERVDLVVVGPEAPLVEGLADRLTAAGISCFGPSAAAARIEASKSYARDICRAAGVPMAMGVAFDAPGPAIEYAHMLGAPLVVKADGLAAGKGVTVCASLAEAEASVHEALEHERFGAAGRRVVVEQFLDGLEASVIGICDGRSAVLLPAARDHKRLLEGDMGPNTGGMGAYSPLPEMSDEALMSLRHDVFLPVLSEMAGRGTPFRGALFAGLMLTGDGPRVLEFNARFGDPETQAILPRLAVPLGPLLRDAAAGRLDGAPPILAATTQAAVAVTLATHGYPDAPRTGDEIIGVDAARQAGALVFGAGLHETDRGSLVTSGGRVLTIVGRGPRVEDAAELAYTAADLIGFDGSQLRRDIGRPLTQVSA